MGDSEETRPCEVHSSRIDGHEKRLDKHEELFQRILNRLPLWATIGFALLLGVVGWLV